MRSVVRPGANWAKGDASFIDCSNKLRTVRTYCTGALSERGDVDEQCDVHGRCHESSQERLHNRQLYRIFLALIRPDECLGQRPSAGCYQRPNLKKKTPLAVGALPLQHDVTAIDYHDRKLLISVRFRNG